MTTGYFGRLIDRAVGRAAVLQPLVPSRFEPAREAPQPGLDSLVAQEAEAVAAPPPESARPARTPAPATADVRAGPDGERSTRESAPLPRLPDARGEVLERPTRRPAESPERPPREAGEERFDALEERLQRAADAVRELWDQVDRERPRDAIAAPAPLTAAPRAVGPDSPPPPQESGPRAIAVAPAAPRAPTAPAPLALGAERKPARDDAAPASRESAPRIHVTIGRVEVRAVSTPPVSARPGPRRAEAHVSLEDYLRGRDRGGR